MIITNDRWSGLTGSGAPAPVFTMLYLGILYLLRMLTQ